MATTIDTFSSGVGVEFGRHMARLANGRLLAIFRDVSNNRIEVWYSDDQGATWSENTSARISLHANFAAGSMGFSLFVDESDHVHICYLGSGLDSYPYCWYRHGEAVGTGGAWGTEFEVLNMWGTATGILFPSMVAHAKVGASGWSVHIALQVTSAGNYQVSMRTLSVSDTYVVTSAGSQTGYGTATVCSTGPRIDFNHTGDGKTVAGSAPHLYVAFRYASGLAFAKWTYASGSWTKGTDRQIDSGTTGFFDAAFDGDRMIIAYNLTATNTVVLMAERDAADTTTTARTPTALSDGAMVDIAICHQGYNKSAVIGAIGTTSDDAKYLKYDRTAGTFGSWVQLEAGTATRISACRGTLGRRADFVWADSSTSIRHGQALFNTAPTAAAWVAPIDGAGADVGAALVLDWTFTDPDTGDGDTQSAYAVRRQIGAGALAYWRASDSTWQAAEVQNTSTATMLTLASGWGADGDANHKYAVKTWDDLGLAGVYNTELTQVPSTPDLPTITAPVAATNWVTATMTVTWTVATQTTYLVELLNQTGTVVLESSGTIASVGLRAHALTYTLLNGVDYQVRVTTANDEGLVGTPDTNAFSVSYTLPATPTVTVTASSVNGYITVASSHPTPGGGQPTVTSADVFVRLSSAHNYPDLERPVGGAGIRIAAGLTPGVSFLDRACSSGVAYEYMVRGWADDLTFADSAWTA
jgi:hypothetical protein